MLKVGFALLVLGVLAGIIVGILFATGVLGTSGGRNEMEQLGYEIAQFGHNYYNALSDNQKANSDCVNAKPVSMKDGIVISYLSDDQIPTGDCVYILTEKEPPGLKKKVMAMESMVDPRYGGAVVTVLALLFKGMDTYMKENISSDNDKKNVGFLIGYGASI